VQYWRGRAQLVSETLADSVEMEALFRSLRMTGTFLAYDIRRPYPAFDPDGALLAASLTEPEIASIGSDNASLALELLPANFQITAGDYLSFARTNGKIALHQAVEDITANGSGTTSEFAVVPPFRNGSVAGAVVTLVKACGEFRMPSGFSPASASGAISEGISFAFEEVL
jgi:hypothetical protein